MKYELGEKTMIKLVGLRGKTYGCLIDDVSEDKKEKMQKMCHKKKTYTWNYKNCLEATQINNKIKYLEKNKTNIDSLKKIINNS